MSRRETTSFLISISFLALFTFSFMKYMDPFPLHLITRKNKISELKLLLQHTYYYVQPIIFIKVADVVVPIIDTFQCTQTNSAKKDGEIAQKNYSPPEMFQDLKNQRTIFEPDVWCSGKRLKANQPKNFSYPKKKFGKVFYFLGTKNGPIYTMTKLKTVYIASFVKSPTITTS